MFLMIWVNDFGNLISIPKWLKHALPNEDFLGFSDLIFPWFLYAMGMAIPFSIENRLKKNESRFKIFKHIIFRSLALIIMGLFHMNMETYNYEYSIIDKPIFVILSTISFFMIWKKHSVNKLKENFQNNLLPVLGMVIILLLLFLYQGKDYNNNNIGFSIHWWGILGLIGWVYFFVASTFLFFQRSIMCAAIGLLISLGYNLVTSNGLSIVLLSWIPSLKLQAFTFSGIISSLIFARNKNTDDTKVSLKIIIRTSLICFILGIIVNNFFIISKISETPTWVLLSLSTAFLLHTFLYWLIDLKGVKSWFSPIKVAGSSTLTCYLVPYLYGSFSTLLNFQLPILLISGFIGLLKSTIYSFFIIQISRYFVKKRIEIKI